MLPLTGHSWPFSHNKSGHFQVVLAFSSNICHLLCVLFIEGGGNGGVVGSQLCERTMRWHNLCLAYIAGYIFFPHPLSYSGVKKQNATRNCKRYQIIFNYVRLVRVTGVARSNAAISRSVPLCTCTHTIYNNHTNRVPARAPGTLIQLQMVAFATTNDKKWGRRVT